MTAHLFTPYALGDLELGNRIIIAPMCQYSAVEGTMNDWHMIHLGSLSLSGAALMFVEATAVEAQGRITAGCTGLYSDENEHAMKRVVEACRAWGQAKIGIQIGHAGRKASSQQPWKGGKSIPSEQPGGWPTIAPSSIAMTPEWQTPAEFTAADIERVQRGFVRATERAMRIGFDALELHCAHGYLLHQFLSPLANTRTDRYGGTLENRMRFVLETFGAVRALWPKTKPLGVRISATDWIEGGWDLEQSVTLVAALKDHGCDFVDVSSGGIDPRAKIAAKPGYQVPLAAAIRARTGMATMAVGLITEPEQAEGIIANGEADMVSLARAFLDDPRWAWHAAVRLSAIHAYPPQYERATQRYWPPAQRYAPPQPKAAE